MSSLLTSQTVVAEDWVGLLTAYCLQQAGHPVTLLWIPNPKKIVKTILLDGLAPWQEASVPDTKEARQFEFLLSQLEDAVSEKKGLLNLDIASAAELESAEQWVMSDVSQESDLQVMDEKVWVNLEPRLMSGAKMAIWRPDAIELSQEAFEQTMLDVLSQQEVEVFLLETLPEVRGENQRVHSLKSSCGKDWPIDSLMLTSAPLAQALLPAVLSRPMANSLVSFFKVYPGFLKHLVQVNGLLLMPQKDGHLSVRSKQPFESNVDLADAENQLWEALQEVYPEMGMFEPLESVFLSDDHFAEVSTTFENVSIVSADYAAGMLQAFHQIMQFSKQLSERDYSLQ
ncbi:hypothetical protein GHNINEIG_00527 [Hydrogenovibrio crunogenus]|uniref:Uncharacterized protein n=1 Tax=Hydrogenovibrio crunogenus TaxID=39765 RepID=A0A4P7NXN7_9GAMM|nr:hypothetical protein [Hydrogenovibrio crunogenus]QBZ82497.1 hypothetical protein GHNINEIG_00527 [Hydrogenovibrio crunogenus]